MDDVYVVENILGKRTRRGTLQYRIKWVGYDHPSEVTWEPIENCDCKDLIEKFEENWMKDRADRRTSRGSPKSLKRGSSDAGGSTEETGASKKAKIMEEKQPSEQGNQRRGAQLDAKVVSRSENKIVQAVQQKVQNTTQCVGRLLSRREKLEQLVPGKKYRCEEGAKIAKVTSVVKGNEVHRVIAEVVYADGSMEIVPVPVVEQWAPEALADYKAIRDAVTSVANRASNPQPTVIQPVQGNAKSVSGTSSEKPPNIQPIPPIAQTDAASAQRKQPSAAKLYRCATGKKIKKILGLKPLDENKKRPLTAVVLYEDGIKELVPAETVGQYDPSPLNAFYEAHWKEAK